MFTGLVQDLGRVTELEPDGDGGLAFAVACGFAADLALGESVAVNGACLTVVKSDAAAARFQVGPETVAKTNLGLLQPGSPVNLERALRAGDRLGGHFVSGHVDEVGSLTDRVVAGEWQTLHFACSPNLLELMVPKGSICVDGISLTLVTVTATGFSVMLIPHTLANTTLGTTPRGGAVNLEADLLAKHVRKLVRGA